MVDGGMMPLTYLKFELVAKSSGKATRAENQICRDKISYSSKRFRMTGGNQKAINAVVLAAVQYRRDKISSKDKSGPSRMMKIDYNT